MKRFSKGLVLIILMTLLMGVVCLPDSVKSKLPNDPVSQWVKNQKVNLGLDLQGGTQLDYHIDLLSVEERNEDEDPNNDVTVADVLEGVRHTIERRVDGLGVSEPNIYISDVAGEKHIIVELAGIKDVEEAKAIVGKTIQLEFKELKTEVDPNYAAKVKTEAEATLQKALQAPAGFKILAEDVQTADRKIEYRENQGAFLSGLPEPLKKALPTLQPGQVHSQLVDNASDFMVSAEGQLVEKKGHLIVRLESKEQKENTKVTEEEKVRASHILVSYKGAERAPESVVRTKEDAQTQADKILEEVQANPDDFAALAERYSDDPTAAGKGGDLDFFAKGAMAPEFERTAFEMEPGELSDVIETSFGFHIIKVTEKKDAVEEKAMEDFFNYSAIFYDTAEDPWKPTGLNGSHFKYATVVYNQFNMPEVSIQFDEEGAELFEEITGRLAGQRMAIFVGGQLISAPQVNGKIPGGQAVISGQFSIQDALNLSKDLNTGAIDAPIVLSGQYTISASLGENALSQSLYAGLIGVIALAVFMILYYRLAGFFAVIALIIYSVIMVFLVRSTGIVMSLAGIAGVILSIGMAVDANILIFERTREEFNRGNGYMSAINSGFDRAWSSIRDSNASSLITCLILWFFGNSIIRGFALMLSLGILVSMFTAINVTRALLRTLNGTKISESSLLLKRGE